MSDPVAARSAGGARECPRVRQGPQSPDPSLDRYWLHGMAQQVHTCTGPALLRRLASEACRLPLIHSLTRGHGEGRVNTGGLWRDASCVHARYSADLSESSAVLLTPQLYKMACSSVSSCRVAEALVPNIFASSACPSHLRNPRAAAAAAWRQRPFPC